MHSAALLDERRLAWPGCTNVRDLGGLAAQNGHGPEAIRPGRIVRSDVLTHLAEGGWRNLLAHGIRTILDLRSASEIAAHPYDIPLDALEAGLGRLHISMLPLDGEMMRLLEQAATRGDEYILFVENYQAPIAAVLRAIDSAPAGGVLYHCQAGKDRTGIITALLLALVGVPDEVIIADYAESGRLLRPGWLQETQEALANGQEPPFEPLSEPETMRALLDHWRTRYGGAAGYMEAIGLADAERRRLAIRLLS
ncbi:MAG: tyrosine-protein phosphatase [Chloroflexi bacterium]|nr:tyrosine-protein phosphatase [Chloroflexota bacterium]